MMVLCHSRVGQPRSQGDGNPCSGAPTSWEEQTDAGAVDETLGQVGKCYCDYGFVFLRSTTVSQKCVCVGDPCSLCNLTLLITSNAVTPSNVFLKLFILQNHLEIKFSNKKNKLIYIHMYIFLKSEYLKVIMLLFYKWCAVMNSGYITNITTAAMLIKKTWMNMNY